MTRFFLVGAAVGGLVLPGLALATPTAASSEGPAVQDDAPATLVADATVIMGGGNVRVRAPAARVTVTRPPVVPVAPRVSGSVTITPAPVVPRTAGNIRVDLQVSPAPPAPPRAPMAPPPPHSAPPAPYGSGTQAAPPPPPPASGHPPPPPASSYYGYRGPSVYVYPRVYSTVWGWWWWAPSCYSCYNYNYNDAPSRPRADDDDAKEEKREREALHVGDYSFGMWGGVQRGAYQDGSIYSDPGVRFTLRHRTSDHIGVDFSGGYFGTTVYPDAAERNGHRVDVPLQLSATYHLFPTLPIQVYGLAGITADYRDFEKVVYTEGYKDFYYNSDRFQDVRFGPHVGLGTEIMLGKDVSFHADARWTYYTVAAAESVQQTVPTAFAANAGLSFFF